MNIMVGRKSTAKKTKKANWMWTEQFFYQLDDLKRRVEKLEKTTKYISDELQKVLEDGK